jgi:hypothetical protein
MPPTDCTHVPAATPSGSLDGRPTSRLVVHAVLHRRPDSTGTTLAIGPGHRCRVA